MNPTYKPILQQPIEGEFEGAIKHIIPKEGEIRLVANKNRECQYYYLGLEQCRNKMLRIAGDPSHKFHEHGFLPCKRLVDAHFRCLTDEKYGYSLEDVPEEGKDAANDFIDCSFKKLAPMTFCRRYFDEVLRGLYRSPNNKLVDYY